MTQTISASVPGQPAAQPPRTGQPGSQRSGQQSTAHAAGAGLILLGVFLLGFLAYLYGISGVQEARAQSNAYATLRAELSQQVAPLAATTPGAPVAILNIPAIGIKNMIVVEGTSPENTELGPGHVRSSPMPGETGVSEIFGRRATFGAPFGRLRELHRGDKVTVITGQGKAAYTVVASGDSSHLVKDPAPARLLLLTACSAAVPTTYCYLDAELTSAPQQDPGGRPPLSVAEAPLSGDSSVLVLTLIWGLALVIISIAGTVAAARWSPWLAYLAAVPPALAVLWNLYQSLAALLPNVY
ncbi:MAG TPA: class E sortase [Streptosporangiaceae bacterium]